mmetsp:Transcript_21365/g.33213  ORF Transcript_21365/g.33213 Transcript_21365/m.33213 type:complete len:152 (-) Transcript_21365:58-513(-)
MQHDYYNILGVQASASVHEIERAYRKISLKLHPDKDQHQAGANERADAFKCLTYIKNTLLSLKKRRIYDQSRMVSRHRALGEASDTVDIHELQWNLDCRCGGTYEPHSEEMKTFFTEFLETGNAPPRMRALLPTLLQCNSCSLRVEVRGTE